MSATPHSHRFVAVVPVKPPAVGKSRLTGLPDDVRRDLAACFALDTVAACLTTPSIGAVLVATDDVPFATRLGAAGCETIPDGVTGDLNGTLRQAAAEAHRRWPELVPVALCADLPALRPDDLAAALAGVGTDEAAFVADASGAGTTLYTAPSPRFEPRFGEGSAAAHADAGARALPGALTSLRRDVDDLADLRTAGALGLGRWTRQRAALLAEGGPLSAG